MLNRLLGNNGKKKLFVISAPAGTGKTTLVDMLIKEFPGNIQRSISYTTRSPRGKEVNGRDYYFITQREFEKKIDQQEMLEYAMIYGCYYGTDKEEVNRILHQGKHAILVIDTQGALQLKQQAHVDAVFIFLEPPSFEVLRNRLSLRGTEEDADIEERLEWAKKEIEAMNHYDYKIVNDELSLTYKALTSIFIAEGHRIQNNRRVHE